MASSERQVVARRGLDDTEMARVVGAGGVINKGPIAFEDVLENPLGDDDVHGYDLAIAYPAADAAFTAKVVDRDGGLGGSYKLQVFDPDTSTVVAEAVSPSPGFAASLEFVTTNSQDALQIRVVENGGPDGRIYELTLGPRYADTTTSLPFEMALTPASLGAGEFRAFEISVGAGQTGVTDIYLIDSSIASGKNVLTLIPPDRLSVESRASKRNDISFDASDFEDLVFDEEGDYLLVLNNDQGTPGSFTIYLGPVPDEPDDCEAITPPDFENPSGPGGTRAIDAVGDRDCFEFTLDHGVTDVGYTLTEVGGPTTGSNEVRVFRNGGLEKAQTGTTNVNGMASVNGEQDDSYRIVVNNKTLGEPSYDLEVRLEGACIGAGCIISPVSAVQVSPGVPIDIRADQAGSALRLDAAASFEFDKKSAGEWTLDVFGDADGAAPDDLLCTGTGTSDFHLENCDLTTLDGLPYLVASNTGNGTTAVVTMGVELADKREFESDSIPFRDVQDGELVGGGDEDYLDFTLASDGQVGCGFDDKGIGKRNVVGIFPVTPGEEYLRDPGVEPETGFDATGDGSCVAVDLPAGDYVLIVDNDRLGDGEYKVCIGPDPDETDPNFDDSEDPGEIEIAGDIGSPGPPASTGVLLCGDSDYWTIQNDGPEQNVKIIVTETDADVGSMVAIFQKVGDPDSEVVKKGAGKAVVITTLEASTEYQLIVDNGSIGEVSYSIQLVDND